MVYLKRALKRGTGQTVDESGIEIRLRAMLR